MISKLLKLRVIHKWLGIVSAIFLLNLGITGFILDHREWGWLYRDAVPNHYLNDEFVKDTAKRAMDTIQKSDSENKGVLIQGGNRGVWWSDDNGEHWIKSSFDHRENMPMVTAIVPDINGSFTTLYIATNDGIWHSTNRGHTFERVGMENQFVNALTYDSVRGGLIGVIDRSDIFRFDTNSSTIIYLQLTPPDTTQLPQSITMGRFVYDLHFGRGVFSGMGSWLWSDIAGIALALLALTGIMFWLLPKYYVARADRGRTVSSQTRGGMYRWIWRMHAPLMGLFASIPILYLSLSGILIDHSKALRPWMKSVDLSRTYLPPVYGFGSLEGEIYGVASYPDSPESLIIGTRYGVFDSNDSGKSWHYAKEVHTFAKGVNREGDTITIKGMGGPDYTKRDGDGWKEKKKKMGRCCDDSKGSLSPVLTHVSWFNVIDGLHTGMIIAPWWSWANDLFAIIATLLVITGLIRWCRKKWL